MKKQLLIFGVAALVFCNNNRTNPTVSSLTTDSGSYGTVAMALPKIKNLDSSDAIFSLRLNVAGKGMSAIDMTWKLSDVDTMVMIGKIPIGDQRIFTGYLISSREGLVCEGADTVEINAGQIAQVYLVLHRTATAMVHIIIDGLIPPVDTSVIPVQTQVSGCYQIHEAIKTIPLDSFELKITVNGSFATGVIMQGGFPLGKLSGPISKNEFFFNVELSYSPEMNYRISLVWKGVFASPFTVPSSPMPLWNSSIRYQLPEFKAKVYKSEDSGESNALGIVYGIPEDCGTVDSIIPPVPEGKCITDTIVFSYWTDPGIEARKVCSADAMRFQIIQKPDSSGKPGITTVTCCTSGNFQSPGSTGWHTMGGVSSCKPIWLWQKYAAEECKQGGTKLGNSFPLIPCGSDSTFEVICFECIK
jgi:hypothetical protein